VNLHFKKGTLVGAAELSANASSNTGDAAVTQGMTSVCLILLLLSAAAEGIVGNVAKLMWLLSLVPLTVMNPGAGLGIYVASAAIYSAPYVYGMAGQSSRFGSLFERPDNFALGGTLLFWMLCFRRRLLWRSWGLAVLISMFLLITFAHATILGLMTRTNFAVFMRMFGFPLILFLLIVGSPVSGGYMRAFFATVMTLTVYLAAISVLEGIDLRALIIPTWVTDPQLNETIGTNRSGGTFLQSEWNGFALCLGFCIMVGLLLMDNRRYGFLKYAAVLLCLAAIYFTFTRAAWLATAAASLLLLLRSPQPRDRLHLKRIFSIAVIGIALFVLILFPGGTAKKRTADTDTVYFRINLWMAGVQMAMNRPILGHGFGQFKEGVVDYHEDTSLVPFANLPEEGMVAHNTMLNILVEQGGLGLLLYLMIFIQIYLRARRASIALSPKAGQIWVTAFTLVYIINTQFIVAYEPTTNFIYYGAMGLLIGTENDGAGS
jgi:O-antigen ligase